jgi:uncharacterized lipoprotein YddW (UPF0748 family)
VKPWSAQKVRPKNIKVLNCASVALNKMIKTILLLTSVFLILTSQAQIKGVWVTNVASDALMSREKIKECVSICKASGFTDIFMVVYNNARTMYPSKIMDSTFGVKIDKRYGERDPLQEMIEEAHQQKLKVHGWFEFGFSSSYDAQGGMIVKAMPHWAALTSDGKLVTKNKFDWLNAFHPEVQDYMSSLVLEVVQHYNIDGVQGDDRLPANPSTAGYDAYTKNLYKIQHQGNEPPTNYKDSAWVQWRSNLLTGFLNKLHREIKAIKPTMLVTMAPSIYPWSKEEYLQDWPTWVQNGYVDYVFPQVYRYNFEAYKNTLTAMTKQLTAQQRKICYPGLLQSLGSGYLTNDTLLTQMITENREQGYNGEIFFYFDGVRKKKEWFANEYKNIGVALVEVTTLNMAAMQKIKDGLKDIKGVVVTFENGKAILNGNVTKKEKIIIMQLCMSAKVLPDISNLKVKN